MSSLPKKPVLPNRFPTFIIIAVAIALLVITGYSIKENQQESYKLVVLQGRAFLESLTLAADNAITAEYLIDYLVHRRYQEIVIDLAQSAKEDIDDNQLASLALNHNLHAIYVYDTDTTLLTGTVVRGKQLRLPESIVSEVGQLLANPEENYLLILDEGETPDEVVHYYLEITNRLDRIVVIVADANYYVSAMEQTQIDNLAGAMAADVGIEYIIYQAPDSLIFSSLREEQVTPLATDSFLLAALESDSIVSRTFEFDGSDLLELAQPFAKADYPYGIIRIGLSLSGYHAISRGYFLQLATVSGVLLVLVIIVVLYFNTRQQRREISREYQEYRSLADKLFADMNTGVAAFNADGDRLLANSAFYQTCSLSENVDSGWHQCEPLFGITRTEIAGSPVDFIERECTLTINNTVRQLLLNFSKLKKSDGSFDGFIIVLSDLTELKELEKKSARRERLSEMGDLAAGVAHEIRNPLNTISIASQRLAGEFTVNENGEEYQLFTRQIKEETKRLNTIITRFLALAREESQQQTELNLSSVIEEFVIFIKTEASDLSISLSTDITPDIKVRGDVDKLKQLMTNLYTNAREALAGTAGSIHISVLQDADTISLTFQDSGPGVPPEIREKVLTPYFTTKEAGTGLGLPTVHKIATEMGGELMISDSDLGGANIKIIFS